MGFEDSSLLAGRQGLGVRAKIKVIMQNREDRMQGEIKKMKTSDPGILDSLNPQVRFGFLR